MDGAVESLASSVCMFSMLHARPQREGSRDGGGWSGCVIWSFGWRSFFFYHVRSPLIISLAAGVFVRPMFVLLFFSFSFSPFST